MNIELKDRNGITLKTAEKYCAEDVVITPKLQSKSVTENGNVVADEGYCGLKSVIVDVPATPTQEKMVDLAMASGNQVISPDAGKNLSKVTVTKPTTLIAENIKKDVSIGGVTGTLETQKEEEGGSATITANGSQTFSPTSGKVFSNFTVTTNVPTGVDISDTTAAEGDVRKGKTFYSSDGAKTQGVIENYGGTSLSMSTTVLTKGQYGMSAAAIGDKIYLHGQNTNFELFDTKASEYSLSDAVTNSITYYAPIATVDKKIYLFGGMKGYQQIAVLDTETDVIDVKSPGYTWEGGCSGASVGDKIYLFGSDSFNRGTTINIYNVTSNTFSKSNVALPISARYVAACTINDKIYLFGGHNTDKSTSVYGTYLDSINMFDVANNTISTLDVRLPVGMEQCGVAALGTKIYLFGGVSFEGERLNTIYEFDTLTNTIKKLDIELPEKMLGIAAATVNGKIYLFGGLGSGIKDFIQIFNPKTSILITVKDGETLPTNGKYCVDDIFVQPALETRIITSNGEVTPGENYCGFEKVVVNVDVQPKLQEKSATPSKTQQTISPDGGYDGLSIVTVNAIPESYVIPTGTIDITANGTHDVSGKASASVNVQPKLQTKTVTPTKSQQTISPDSSYDGLSSVTVNTIPADYIIPSGSQNITANGTYDIKDKASVIVAVPSEKPTLNAPTITIDDKTLKITNPASNGNFVTKFKVFSNGTALTEVVIKGSSTTVDLSGYFTTDGTYTINVKASAANFNDSALSNGVSYVVKTQTTPVISLVSGTTIQIDTIDDNATTIEVYADGNKIGEVSKQ